MAGTTTEQGARNHGVGSKTPSSRGQIIDVVLGLRATDPRAVIEAIEAGVDSAAVGRLAEYFEVAEGQVLEAIDIPRSTFSRRKKEGRRLSGSESDRLYRVTRLLSRAVEVFSDDEQARSWMRTPKRALGGVSPLMMARTDAGAQEVEDLLGRIEHGIPS